MPAHDATCDRLLSGAHTALQSLGVRAVEPGGPVVGGSGRSHLVRAIADRGNETPLKIIIKAPIGQGGAFGRERAGLTLVRDHQLPGVVPLLGVIEDPRALILEDLGDGPSVADHLLGNSRSAAERAVMDWAQALGRLHAASKGLQDSFSERLSRFAGDREPLNLTRSLLVRTADRLSETLAPYGIAASPASIAEIHALLADREPLPSEAEAGLVPGDCCPDNAMYAGDVLTLIDFEAASYRPAAWDATYLTVPWPTCWCSWALPTAVSQAAIAAWRETSSSENRVTADDLGTAEILWALIALGLSLPRITSGEDDAVIQSPDDSARPARRAVLLHRLEVAANAATTALPHVRALTATAHHMLEARWGTQPLSLAPAFRDTDA